MPAGDFRTLRECAWRRKLRSFSRESAYTFLDFRGERRNLVCSLVCFFPRVSCDASCYAIVAAYLVSHRTRAAA